MNYYLCFYHLYLNKHLHYHHVILHCEPQYLINLEDKDYLYFIRSSKAVYLTKEELNSEIIQGLIMDGESLLKRIKKQVNQVKNESISV